LIRIPLSQKMLFEELNNCHVSVICNNNKMDFEVIPKVEEKTEIPLLETQSEAEVSEDGVIVLTQFKPK